MKPEKEKLRKLMIGSTKKLSKNLKDLLSTRYDVNEIILDDENVDRHYIDVLVFQDGPDVHPSYYGEQKGRFTKCNESKTGNVSTQDELEKIVYDYHFNTPKLGIGRGSNLLNVFAGGKLIQHVEGHKKPHLISLQFEGNPAPSTFLIPSSHHQMMFPYNLPQKHYQVLSWATTHMSIMYIDGKEESVKLPNRFVEPEIIFFPQRRALAIQGNPEDTSCESGTKKLCLNLIDNYLL